MKCQNCQKDIPSKIKIKNKVIRLTSRKFCTECSPVGNRNTRQYIVDTNEDESYCSRCGDVKNIKEFYHINNRVASYCKDCQKQVKKIKGEEKLQLLIELKGTSCSDCSIVFPVPVYVFYDGEKVFPKNKIQHFSIEKLKEKMENYFLICSNCKIIREWINSK